MGSMNEITLIESFNLIIGGVGIALFLTEATTYKRTFWLIFWPILIVGNLLAGYF